jgi:hypothetical protein
MLIFEQINAIYRKVGDLADVIGKIGRGQLSELRIGSVPSIAQVMVRARSNASESAIPT